MAVLLETSAGDITIDLFTEIAPRACLNFLKLCKIKYYNNVLFHNVQKDYVVQTGDPTGVGNGGESIWGVLKGESYRYFQDEISPLLKHDKFGTVSMASGGHNMNGSQFIITTTDQIEELDEKRTIFGVVSEGADALRAINSVYVDGDGRPYQDVRILHTIVLDDPFPDPDNLVVPERSPEPAQREKLDTARLRYDEQVDENEGKTEAEVTEERKRKAARSRAEVLEIVGDIPDADMAPPENVLFVCKLNPVTEDEDLELIFSRFGKIVSCEVIRDHITDESLCYAFIEFSSRKECEDAYFKMDNVLIDDRRIHVNFCQSVAKSKFHQFLRAKRDSMGRGGAGGMALKSQQKQDNYDLVDDDEPAAPKERPPLVGGLNPRGAAPSSLGAPRPGRGGGGGGGGGRDRGRGARSPQRRRSGSRSRDERGGGRARSPRRSSPPPPQQQQQQRRRSRSRDGGRDDARRGGGGDRRDSRDDRDRRRER